MDMTNEQFTELVMKGVDVNVAEIDGVWHTQGEIADMYNRGEIEVEELPIAYLGLTCEQYERLRNEQ